MGGGGGQVGGHGGTGGDGTGYMGCHIWKKNYFKIKFIKGIPTPKHNYISLSSQQRSHKSLVISFAFSPCTHN